MEGNPKSAGTGPLSDGQRIASVIFQASWRVEDVASVPSPNGLSCGGRGEAYEIERR